MTFVSNLIYFNILQESRFTDAVMPIMPLCMTGNIKTLWNGLFEWEPYTYKLVTEPKNPLVVIWKIQSVNWKEPRSQPTNHQVFRVRNDQ